LGRWATNLLELDDSGYDIGSYFAAAKVVINPRLLFLNTFCEILADNWLAHFDKALNVSGVRLVGATGSWQSASSSYEAVNRRSNFARRMTMKLRFLKAYVD
jgi:hypothetical protein